MSVTMTRRDWLARSAGAGAAALGATALGATALGATALATPALAWRSRGATSADDLWRLDAVAYTPIHNAAGTAAMSVPLGWSAAGLPIGVQFATVRGGERTLFELACELEAAAPWANRWPDPVG